MSDFDDTRERKIHSHARARANFYIDDVTSDITASRIQRESAVGFVQRLPEGIVKSELKRALDRIEKKIARELEASQSAWAAEPILKRIETSKVTVRNGTDLLVLLTHCLFLEQGLESDGILNQHVRGNATGSTSTTTTTTTTGEENIIPNGWNATEDGVYGLLYKVRASTSPKAKTGDVLTLKALQISDLVSFHLIQERTGKSVSLELKGTTIPSSRVRIPIPSFVLRSRLRLARTATDFVAKERIIRADNIEDLRARLRSQLIERLLPPPPTTVSSRRAASVGGRRDTSDSTLLSERYRRPRRGPEPDVRRDPLIVPGVGGGLDRDRLPHFAGGFDVDPLGGVGGGGSLVGPNHPMFAGRRPPTGGGRPGPNLPGRIPGARFDPFGPGVPLGPRRGGGRVGPRGPGPSPDHLPPPRFESGGDDDEPPSGMFF